MNSVNAPPPIRVRISDHQRVWAWVGVGVVGLSVLCEVRLWRVAADVGHPPGFFAFGWVTVRRLLTYGGVAPLVIACKTLLLAALTYTAIVSRGFGSIAPEFESPLWVMAVVGAVSGLPLLVVALIAVFNVLMWTLAIVLTIAVMLVVGTLMAGVVLVFLFLFFA